MDRPPSPGDAEFARGVAAFRAGDHAAAEAAFRKVVTAAPSRADAWANLGAVLNAGGAFEGALDAYRRAIRLAPDLATAWLNAGLTLARLERLEEALESLERAASLDHRGPQPHQLAAGIARDLGRLDVALRHATRAVEIAGARGLPEPVRGDALLELAHIQLGLGVWTEAWASMDKGMSCVMEHRWPVPGPRWDGSAAPGRKLLVWGDQGFGDMLHFGRYLVTAAERADVTTTVPAPLRRLFGTLRAPVRVSDGADLAWQIQCPMHALPGIIGVTRDRIGIMPPYFHPDPSDVARWQERLATLPGLRVGLCWAGGTDGRVYDGRRSMRLEDLGPLFDLDAVDFVSLQKGAGAGETASMPRILDWTDELRDFADTAALIGALDLVISVDTAVAHLAGAIDAPVWMINKICSDGRWPIGGPPDQGTPWYPSMRIFRQTEWRSWAATVLRVREALAARSAEIRPSLP